MIWNARVHCHVHSQTLTHILSQMISFHICFFKHTEYTASAHLHTLLRISATCKSIYALLTTLYGEVTQTTFFSDLMTDRSVSLLSDIHNEKMHASLS
jgi:hypothetical protein